ncbi:MAG: helix-turn-helix transcriptional regulator [Synergistaceae bacterium]|nr:helix-turn-helix transcriptional regulator [Synergistaceae bacterium]
MEGSVAQNIRNFRNKKGITQSELAKETDLSRNTIVNFETARRDPRVKDLKKIANALDVPIEQLLAD